MFYIFTIKIVILTVSLVNSEFSDEDDISPSTPDPLDEWHMDYVPTGYLPDSVYRELAWYGILQVQPLYRSTKHKVAAQWIWQNTLGRPYVIVENQPQSTQSEGTASHQSISEDSAKWSRERRMAQDVLMENVRSGGNGLTVRTVISASKKTVYIIQSGKYYSCEDGSEPDVDAFRAQANIHERKCTSGKQAVQLPLLVDPCIDAEAAPLEYSYNNEWMFCLGDAERDATHSPDGDVDCGKKIKMRFKDFLEQCAIDNNVVITYEYFGDEPRKDMIHNTTLCTSWDPCRISYLYRLEVPDNVPEIPTTSPDPCDTTICPECLEGFSEEYFDPDADNDSSKDDKLGHDVDVEWVPTTVETFDKVKNRALVGGYEATGKRVYIIRSVASRTKNIVPGFFVENATKALISCCSTPEQYEVHQFDVAVAQAELEWVPADTCPQSHAINAGNDNVGLNYVCRMTLNGDLLPGSYHFPDRMSTVRGFLGLCLGRTPLQIKLYKIQDHEMLCRVK